MDFYAKTIKIQKILIIEVIVPYFFIQRIMKDNTPSHWVSRENSEESIFHVCTRNRASLLIVEEVT